MKKGLIEIEEMDLYFNKCICCGTDAETKKVKIGNANREEVFVLCKDCRAELYNKLKEQFEI
ncbi:MULTISPECIES: hypothetical protein [Clostridium]|uniref:hypothetical protein n=1 Tax=Clostridium TaxID=1485 RepID=UPI00290139CD|nr:MULTISPECIES: hypothetical protein [Clostridium]MDU1229897.1 hypothetical protein [Clostridium sp.]